MSDLMRSADLANALCEYFSRELRTREKSSDQLAVSFPLEDDSGDTIELLLEFEPEFGWVVTDGGHVAHEVGPLVMGTTTEDGAWAHVEQIAGASGLQWSDGEIWQRLGSVQESGEALLKVALAVRDALQVVPPAFAAAPRVKFQEEMQLFFDDQRIPYRSRVMVRGVSEIRHRVDFVLQNGHRQVAQGVATEGAMRRALNIFYDLIPREVPVVAFVDDQRSEYNNETFQQLLYLVPSTFLWSRRNAFLEYWEAQSY